MITTELNGATGVCSVVDPASYQTIIGRYGSMKCLFSSLQGERQWKKPDIFRGQPTYTGLNGSLKVLSLSGAEQLRLGWATDEPDKVLDAIHSVSILNQCAWPKASHNVETKRMPLQDAVLEVSLLPYDRFRGVLVQATFGEQVWDFIGSDSFTAVLPEIEARLSGFWSRQYSAPWQHISLLETKDGLELQLKSRQPDVPLFCGKRRRSEGERYQFVSNSFYPVQTAYAHVFGLCLVLDYCRQAARSQQQAAV